jgi:hypothetical protein
MCINPLYALILSRKAFFFYFYVVNYILVLSLRDAENG